MFTMINASMNTHEQVCKKRYSKKNNKLISMMRSARDHNSAYSV